MNDEELSDWSAPGEKPPRKGVWATDYSGFLYYQYFDGAVFKFAAVSVNSAFMNRSISFPGDQSKLRFRGLVNKP